MKTCRSIAVLLLLAGFLVACGADDDDDATAAVGPAQSTEMSGTTEAGGHGDMDNPCGDDSKSDAMDMAVEGKPVTVTATDYEFAGIDGLKTGGMLAVTLENKGDEPHELVIQDSDGKQVAYGLACPGEKATFAAALDPGSYTAICMVETDGKSHADRGMKVDFEVS